MKCPYCPDGAMATEHVPRFPGFFRLLGALSLAGAVLIFVFELPHATRTEDQVYGFTMVAASTILGLGLLSSLKVKACSKCFAYVPVTK